MNVERCDVCGAPRPAGHPCAYCRAGGTVFSLAGLAAATRRDAESLEALLPSLAHGLEEALPRRVTVRRGGGLFRSGDRIDALTADVGDERFSAERSGRGYLTRVEMAVRGVTLRRDEVEPSVWLERLAQALERHSASVGVDPAITRLLGSAGGV